jgi:hypothetical protein
VTWEQPIDQATFADLWNGIAGGKVFWPFIISDASEQIDPLAFHVIGVAFTHKDGLLQSTFLVPATEQDPEFVRWLGLLNVPEDRI